ncbi:MAG: alanine dehydrogenase [Spiroplasma sp.]|nr:alanine dehydrogenase [Spiroplasma sp.]
MKIGIVKEIKNNENRVAITPAGVQELVKNNHEVMIEFNSGINSGFTNEAYQAVGAKIISDPAVIWQQDLVIKVKEPLKSEYKYFRKGLILFTYLHLAANLELTKELLKNKVIAIAYETVQLPNGHLPLLAPMSEIAGRRSVIFGATLLEKHHHEQKQQGILLSSIPGVNKTKVLIIGGGTAGYNAAQIAIGLQAQVTILELNEERIRFLEEQLNHQCQVLKSNVNNLTSEIIAADLVISTVLIPGAKAPKLITEAMVKTMKKGSVIIDIAIDQGGSVETIVAATTHDRPTFLKHNVIHSAVANIPGAVAKTSTLALTNATLPYINLIATSGLKEAIIKKPELKLGINCYDGNIVLPVMAQALTLPYLPLTID